MFVLFFYPFLIVHSKTKKKNFIQKKTPFVRYNSEVLIHLYGFIEPLPVANVRKIENWNIKIATTKKSVIIKIVIYKTKKKDQLLSIKRKNWKKDLHCFIFIAFDSLTCNVYFTFIHIYTFFWPCNRNAAQCNLFTSFLFLLSNFNQNLFK